MASPSGEPEWANPREIVRTIVTMSQMCRRKPNTPLRFWSSQTFFLIPERRAKNEILAGSKMGGIPETQEMLCYLWEGGNCWAYRKYMTGQTSSKEESARFRKEFTLSQKEDQVGRLLLKCCHHLSSERQREILVGLALPNDPQHRRLIMSIAGVLSNRSIYIFRVGDRIQVEPELPETKMSP